MDDKKELLEKARRDYPIGTHIISAYSSKRGIVSQSIFHDYSDGDITVATDCGEIIVYKYKYNEWAGILNKPEVKRSLKLYRLL